MKLTKLALYCAIAVTLAGCTTSQQGNAAKADLAQGARDIVGTSLIGAKGATPKDQNNIDEAVAGLCVVGSYGKSECRRHQEQTK